MPLVPSGSYQMRATPARGKFLRLDLLTQVALYLVLIGSFLLMPTLASASSINQLYRLDIRPQKEYTRIILKLANPPAYTLSHLPGNRLRLILPDTRGTLFKKYRRYADTNIGGLSFRERGKNLMITFQVGAGRGWRDLTVNGVSAITLDIGTRFKVPPSRPSMAGRERIWNGVEKLVRDFDPPLKPEIPFLPTDRQVLKSLLAEQDIQAFLAAEGALYKGRLSEAEEGFTAFVGHQGAIKAISLYRLGETYYKLQKYPQALKAFREGEALWPAFLNLNPGVTFYYGDSIARAGDLAAARAMLASLIARLADKKFAPVLLVRLADILVRQGHEPEALALYQTLANNFTDNKANLIAQMRLYDRDFLKATPLDYRRLGEAYLDISRKSGDMDLREESFFKYVLLEAIHGEAPEALRQVVYFQKKFPRGIYAAVCRTIREVLVEQVYLQSDWSKDSSGLIRFVEEHQDYLVVCVSHEDFLVKVAQAYEEAGRPIELVKLFNSLLERQWASAGGPFMYETIATNAELLGDMVMTEKTLKLFLKKYPAHPHSRQALEHLGRLYFDQQKYQASKDSMFWLLNKGERAHRPESYYYLGKALFQLKLPSQAAKAMESFINQAKTDDQLLPDAYLAAISAREASGDRKGALHLLEKGLKLPPNPRSEELLYRAGELNLNEGRQKVARTYFEQLAKGGKDLDWQNLARKALVSLDARYEKPK